ncbi:hypothetical protein N7451_009462 [Penicillium sp. IBT 35674x]|nr:hypothetical protein N7451_009462 [Penicillium sp. IBT 35674x]
MAEGVESLAKEKEVLLDFMCMSSVNDIRSYGPDNIERMQETAAKYDPEGIFQKPQHGGFLLRDNI